jgi:hypothetical protein
MKIAYTPSSQVYLNGRIWAEGVLANDWEAAEFLYRLKEDDEQGYEILMGEIKSNWEFFPETKLLLAIFYDDDLWERMQRVAQAIWVMSVTEIDKPHLN